MLTEQATDPAESEHPRGAYGSHHLESGVIGACAMSLPDAKLTDSVTVLKKIRVQ